MTMQTLEELFVHGLRDIYHAENQLTKALPKMAKSASDQELRQAFEQHLEQTRGQIDRLTQIFESLELRTRGVRCVAMEGLIEEGKELMDEVEDPAVKDAGMIGAAQKVEHYEIASYASLATLADQLGHGDAASLLRETLEEEKQTDELLADLATRTVSAGGAEDGANGSVDEDVEMAEAGAGGRSGRTGKAASGGRSR